MLGVAEADLQIEGGFVRMKGAPGMPQIARRACGRERSAFQGFTMARVASRAARVRRAPPQTGDRGFESISLQRGVCLWSEFQGCGQGEGAKKNQRNKPMHREAILRALNSGQTSSGTLLCRFLILCARQRWRTERGKHSSMARMIPGAPSLATSSGSGKPRPASKPFTSITRPAILSVVPDACRTTGRQHKIKLARHSRLRPRSPTRTCAKNAGSLKAAKTPLPTSEPMNPDQAASGTLPNWARYSGSP